MGTITDSTNNINNMVMVAVVVGGTTLPRQKQTHVLHGPILLFLHLTHPMAKTSPKILRTTTLATTATTAAAAAAAAATTLLSLLPPTTDRVPPLQNVDVVTIK